MLSLIGKQCFQSTCGCLRSPWPMQIGKPSIRCHIVSDGDMPKHLRPNRLSAFLSATDNNRWCLCACRRGTLRGMDAAPEATGTYLRRVLRRYACKRPRQTAASAWNRQRSCTSLPGLRSWSAARCRM
ncbi:hypothetical protein FPL04_06440 [Xanthomonas arboricola]|nr:hypothetical protein FPL04_06440 [Xanthomonas arboricola]